MNGKLRTLSFGVVLGATALLGASAEAQFGNKPGKGEQKRLGTTEAAKVRQVERVLPDSDPRVQLLRRMGNKMVASLDPKYKKDNWAFTFDVIESKDVNAFAFPGGPVFFYTGIIDRMKSEDELAGVLSHELTHVYREHWAYSMRNQGRNNIFLTAGALLGAPNGILQAGSLLSSITGLRHSRDHETQADTQGFDLVVKTGYNPQVAVQVFRMMQSLGGGG